MFWRRRREKRQIWQAIGWACHRDCEARKGYWIQIVCAIIKGGVIDPEQIREATGPLVDMVMHEKAATERRSGMDPAWTEEMQSHWEATAKHRNITDGK